MTASARTRVGRSDRASLSASSALRAPTYLYSEAEKVISATFCIVTLSSAQRIVLLMGPRGARLADPRYHAASPGVNLTMQKCDGFLQDGTSRQARARRARVGCA